MMRMRWFDYEWGKFVGVNLYIIDKADLTC